MTAGGPILEGASSPQPDYLRLLLALFNVIRIIFFVNIAVYVDTEANLDGLRSQEAQVGLAPPPGYVREIGSMFVKLARCS